MADSKVDTRENTEYYTTYEERLKYLPAQESDLGHWEGERGESKFIPNNEDVKKALAEYGLDGIVYKDGIPDFSPCSEANVEISMTAYRLSTIDENSGERIAGNFEKADAKCAEQWNAIGKDGKTDWTTRDVEKWRHDNHYTWHECSDRKTCNLVSSVIHNEFKHTGGVAECKRRDLVNVGGGFDA